MKKTVLLQITDANGQVLATINSESEVEILCTKEQLDDAMKAPMANDYYRCTCILFKCILSLNGQNK